MNEITSVVAGKEPVSLQPSFVKKLSTANWSGRTLLATAAVGLLGTYCFNRLSPCSSSSVAFTRYIIALIPFTAHLTIPVYQTYIEHWEKLNKFDHEFNLDCSRQDHITRTLTNPAIVYIAAWQEYPGRIDFNNERLSDINKEIIETPGAGAGTKVERTYTTPFMKLLNYLKKQNLVLDVTHELPNENIREAIQSILENLKPNHLILISAFKPRTTEQGEKKIHIDIIAIFKKNNNDLLYFDPYNGQKKLKNSQDCADFLLNQSKQQISDGMMIYTFNNTAG